MDCEKVEQLMSLLLLDELEEQEKRELMEHVETCPVCKEKLGDMRVTVQLLNEALTAGPAPKLSSEARGRLMAAVARESAKKKPEAWTLVSPLFRKAVAGLTKSRRITFRRAAIAAGVVLVCGVVVLVVVGSARKCQMGPMITDADAEGYFAATEEMEGQRVMASTSMEPAESTPRGGLSYAYDNLRQSSEEHDAVFGVPSAGKQIRRARGSTGRVADIGYDAPNKPAESAQRVGGRIAWKGGNRPDVATTIDTAGTPRGFHMRRSETDGKASTKKLDTTRDADRYYGVRVLTTERDSIRGDGGGGGRDYGNSMGGGGGKELAQLAEDFTGPQDLNTSGSSASASMNGKDLSSELGGVGGALGYNVLESDGRSKVLRHGYLTAEQRRAEARRGNKAGEAGAAGDVLYADGHVKWTQDNYVSNGFSDKTSDASQWGSIAGGLAPEVALSGPGAAKEEKAFSFARPAEEAADRLTTDGKRASDVEGTLFASRKQLGDRTIVLSEQKKAALERAPASIPAPSATPQQPTVSFEDAWHADTESSFVNDSINNIEGRTRIAGEKEAIRELTKASDKGTVELWLDRRPAGVRSDDRKLALALDKAKKEQAAAEKKLAAAREYEAVMGAQEKARKEAERKEQALVQLYKDASAMKRTQWDGFDAAKDKAIDHERLMPTEKLKLAPHTVTYPASDMWTGVTPGNQSVQMQATLDMLREDQPGPTTKPGASSKADVAGEQQFVRLTPDEFEQVVSTKAELKEVHNLFAVTPTESITTEEPTSTMIEEPETAAVFEAPPVNPWVMTGEDRLSTFALDVDTASFSVARSYINGGYLPPEASVRMEEFVNYFDYNYPSQTEAVFTVYPEAAPSPFRPGLTLLKVGIRGKVLGRDARKRAHLVFVVDASGSMAKPDRMPLVKYALTSLVEQLDAGDRVSLVAYGSRARLVLEAVPADRREQILETIDAIQCGGSTNLLEGVKLGYEIAKRAFQAGEINRVILCSDGVANIGSTTAEEMLDNVEMFRDHGIGLTAAGFGSGAYNDVLMEKLANKGDGNYVFVDSRAEARRVFVEEMAATLQTIAKDAKIQVEFDPARVRRYRLIGFENRDIADEDFRNDAIDAGEVGSGQSSTALYEVELLDSADWAQAPDLGTVYVRYRNVETGEIEEISQRLDSAILRARKPQDSPRFYLAACAATFAEILRGSEHAANVNFDAVRGLLEQVVNELPLDERAQELLDMVRKAKGLPRGN